MKSTGIIRSVLATGGLVASAVLVLPGPAAGAAPDEDRSRSSWISRRPLNGF